MIRFSIFHDIVTVYKRIVLLIVKLICLKGVLLALTFYLLRSNSFQDIRDNVTWLILCSLVIGIREASKFVDKYFEYLRLRKEAIE